MSNNIDTDFLGFTIGNVHSSELNIIRISNNNRYTENLIADFTDSTDKVVGADGTYYWNTSYTKRPFIIDFAFDNLTDEDIRNLKRVFYFKGLQPLVFDETPYKKYMVKCSSPPALKYIPFTINGTTVYKGEGTANLVAYYPYGISTEEISPESPTWFYDVNNTGDLEAPFRLIYNVTTTRTINESRGETRTSTLISSIYIGLQQQGDREIIKELNLENIELESGDSYICIDTRTNLIEGLDSSQNKTGNLYNKYIVSGDFFKLPLVETGTLWLYSMENQITPETNISSMINNRALVGKNWESLKFNYLYY